MHKKVPDDRARDILRALVEHYIRDGQPVGSRTLSKATGLALSPATIRNVMSDLEEFGLIASPHTSAGRIPTAKGYRVFVDTLVKFRQLGSEEITRLQAQLSEDEGADAKTIVANASEALSALTSLAGLVTVPKQSQLILRHVEFVQISSHRVLAILVVNDHEVQNRVLNTDREFGESKLRQAANYLNENFGGKAIGDIREEILSALQRTRENMNQLMLDTINIAQQALGDEAPDSGFVVAGETKLMGFDGISDIDKLRQLFEAFNQQREILGLLDRSIEAEGVQIFIGEESGYHLLDDCSIVTAPYRIDDDIVGVLGVIGPTRMAYERVVPIVDITAKLVGAALNSGH
ncbi:MAG: heat-inducible transcriptional repressor HrcA [Gammaproteobacteria bacterium]